jgi:hypothetical protein
MHLRRIATRWRANARRSKLAKVQKHINSLPDASRFAPCRKCCGPVENYLDDAQQRQHPGADVTASQVYHKACLPRCQVCYESPLFPAKCECERAKQRRCSGCKVWMNKFRALPCKVPKSEAFPAGIDYVCGKCVVPCFTCKSAMPPSSKWSNCYPCAVNARRKRAAEEAGAVKRRKVEEEGGSGGLCVCGAEIDPAYTECYASKHL